MKLQLTLTCMALLLTAAIGCDESPVSTDAGGGGGGGGINFQDVPAIPTPASPGGSVPATSDVHTTVRRLDGPFRAFVARARGTWIVDQRFTFPTTTQWLRIVKRAGWSDEDYGALVPLGNPVGHMLMADHGRPVASVGGEFTRTNGIFEVRYTFSGEGLGAPVYIRRDRQWELKTLEGGAGDFLLLEGNAQGTLSTSYTRGSSETNTREFGQSLTVSAGVGIGPLSASVEGTLSQTFSTSVTVEKSQTETFEKTVTGEPGKIIQFQVWELVDRYSFCDASGDPLEHADYKIKNVVWTRRGSAAYLQTTAFDK